MTALKTNPEREEFARLAADLGSDDEAKRRSARRALDGMPHAEQVEHILALWPELELPRRRIEWWARRAGILAAVIFFLSLSIEAALLLLRAPEAIREAVEWVRFSALASLGVTRLIYSAYPVPAQKGVARLLLASDDPRLVGPMIDALDFAPLALGKGAADEVRSRIRAKLTRLLPRLPDTDVAALEPCQHRALLAVVERFAMRLRSKSSRAVLNADEAAFLVAVLGALEAEGLSPREEKTIGRLAESPQGLDYPDARWVTQSAGDALVRLRGGSGRDVG